MTQLDWPARLIGVVASEVKRHRQRRGLSAQQLADACAELGLPIQRSVLANLESGRRTNLSVPELLVIAAALKVAPVLLVFPVGREALSEFLPERTAETWRAAQWFGGHGEDPTPTVNADRERVHRLPVRLYADHEQAIRRLSEARANADALRTRARTENGDIARALELAEENVTHTVGILRDLRRYMRDQGIQPPAISERTAAALDASEERL